MTSPFPETLRALEADVASRRAWLALAALVLGVAVLAGFRFSRVPIALYERSTSAAVRVAAASYAIDAPAAGRIWALFLRSGQTVEGGEVLAEISAPAVGERLLEEKGRASRLGRELALAGEQLAAARRAGAERAAAAGAAVAESQARVEEAAAARRLAEDRLDRQQRLLSQGLVPAAAAAAARAEAEERAAAGRAFERAAERAGEEERLARQEAQGAVLALERERARLAGEVAAAQASAGALRLELGRQVVRAPAAGTITEVSPTRVGSVVAAGEHLAVLVPRAPRVPAMVADEVSPTRAAGENFAVLLPDARFVVAAEFSSAALGRLAPGQRAWVRCGGSPRARARRLEARTRSVAPAARAGAVRVELALVEAPRGPLLRDGLPAEVEVEVERVGWVELLLRGLRMAGEVGFGREGAG